MGVKEYCKQVDNLLNYLGLIWPKEERSAFETESLQLDSGKIMCRCNGVKEQNIPFPLHAY